MKIILTTRPMHLTTEKKKKKTNNNTGMLVELNMKHNEKLKQSFRATSCSKSLCLLLADRVVF